MAAMVAQSAGSWRCSVRGQAPDVLYSSVEEKQPGVCKVHCDVARTNMRPGCAVAGSDKMAADASAVTGKGKGDMPCGFNRARDAVAAEGCLPGTALPRLTVGLDIDETLIHSRLHGQRPRFENHGVGRDAESFEFRTRSSTEDLVTVWVRPGMKEFLRRCGERYNTYAFTASEAFYAEPLLERIDPRGAHFKGLYTRKDCVKASTCYAKDLRVIAQHSEMHPIDVGEAREEIRGNDLEEKMSSHFSLARTVLVDNNPMSFFPQPSNGVPVVSWYSNPEDTALEQVSTFLQNIETMPDVRPYLDSTFCIGEALRSWVKVNPRFPASRFGF